MKNSAEETEPRENRHGRALGLFTGPGILPNLIHMLRALTGKQATRWLTWVTDAEMEILRGKRKGTPVGSLVPYTRAGAPTAQGLTHQQLFWDPQETRGKGNHCPKIGGTTRGAQGGTHRIRLVHKVPLDPGLPGKPDLNLRNLLEAQGGQVLGAAQFWRLTTMSLTSK